MAMAYDPEARATGIGSLTAGYRADGLRAWKQVGSGARTYFYYDRGEPVLETDASGNVTATNVFAPDGLVARGTASGWTQYAFDPEGSVAQRLTGNGNVLSSSAYDGYGQEASAGTPTDPFGYHARDGYVLDRETGLYYCQARYYDPGTGRWVTRDPIGYAGGVNLYGYCGSGPIGRSDRSGLQDDDDDDAYEMYLEAHQDDDDDESKEESTPTPEPPDPPMPEPDMGPYDPTAGLTTSTKLAEDCFVDLSEPARREHILDGEPNGSGGHRSGTGRPGKSEFPPDWSDDEVMHHASDVATDPASSRQTQSNVRVKVEGTRKGVDIRVILGRPSENGRIITAFPTNTSPNP